MQRQDAVILVARTLSRLTPVRTPSASADSSIDFDRHSIGKSTSMSDCSGTDINDRTNEAVGTTTAAALLRSQACNKVLNLLQQVMKFIGTSGLLRTINGNIPSRIKSDEAPLQADSRSKSTSGASASDIVFLPLTVQSEQTISDSENENNSPNYDYPADSADSGVSDEGKLIMRSVTRILMAGPRTMLWFPALLKAAEVLQVLVLDASGAAEFLATMYSERVPLAHGTLESHILLDMLNSINSTLQPQRLRPVRALEHHSVDL